MDNTWLKNFIECKKERSSVKSVNKIAQHIMSSHRSNCQISYESIDGRGFQKDKHTPFTVGMELTSYKGN